MLSGIGSPRRRRQAGHEGLVVALVLVLQVEGLGRRSVHVHYALKLRSDADEHLDIGLQ